LAALVLAVAGLARGFAAAFAAGFALGFSAADLDLGDLVVLFAIVSTCTQPFSISKAERRMQNHSRRHHVVRYVVRSPDLFRSPAAPGEHSNLLICRAGIPVGHFLSKTKTEFGCRKPVRFRVQENRRPTVNKLQHLLHSRTRDTSFGQGASEYPRKLISATYIAQKPCLWKAGFKKDS
jgi:hypothetical protein